jgi:hypothetical protein
MGFTPADPIVKILKVEFAPPSPWPARLAYAASTAILATALWQGILAWRGYEHLRAEHVQTASMRQRMEVAFARLAPPAAPASAPPYERDAREIARSASFDVGGVLRAIESAQVVGAKVASIDIDTQARSVGIALDVASPDVATAYAQALNGDDPHPFWVLARLQSQAGGNTAEIRAIFP